MTLFDLCFSGGRGGMRGGKQVIIEPHRHEGTFSKTGSSKSNIYCFRMCIYSYSSVICTY